MSDNYYHRHVVVIILSWYLTHAYRTLQSRGRRSALTGNRRDGDRRRARRRGKETPLSGGLKTQAAVAAVAAVCNIRTAYIMCCFPWRACASVYLLRFVSRLKDLCSDLRCRLNHSACSRPSPPHCKFSRRRRTLPSRNSLRPPPPQRPTSAKLLGGTRFELSSPTNGILLI